MEVPELRPKTVKSRAVSGNVRVGMLVIEESSRARKEDDVNLIYGTLLDQPAKSGRRENRCLQIRLIGRIDLSALVLAGMIGIQ